jgi:amidase
MAQSLPASQRRAPDHTRRRPAVERPRTRARSTVPARTTKRALLVPIGIAAAAAIGFGGLTATAAVAEPVVAQPILAAAPSVGSASGIVYDAPAYTSGDLDGDGRVTTSDLGLLTAALGATPESSVWPTVSKADLNGDGVITASDIALLSQQVIYNDGPFDILEASALDIQKAMEAGTITAVSLTQMYLDRSAAYDDSTGLNSMITVNSHALEIAAALDTERATSGPRGMLHGIPVIAKDNYNTVDMPTSAGCTCLQFNQTDADSRMVDRLRSEGAVILGKANLAEFAISTNGISSLGGTTLNAYLPTATSGGSSAGTGASISANFGVIGLGTDTGGSIRIPSSWNSLVGVRPTVGLTSRDGIIPLALSQDVGGPMTRTVSDAAIALDAVAGSDDQDPATALADANKPASYTSSLKLDGLQGKRVGYATNLVGSNATAVKLMEQAKATLVAQGATVVDVEVTLPTFASGSTNEMAHDINEYLAKFVTDPRVPYTTFQGIAAGTDHLQSLNSTLTTRAAVTEETYQAWMVQHSADIESTRTLVTGVLDSNNLDAIVFPATTGLATQSSGNNNRLSPFTGFPSIVVPIGYAGGEATAGNVGGSLDMEILGRAYTEPKLFEIAYSYEQASKLRVAPSRFPALPGTAAPTATIPPTVG